MSREQITPRDDAGNFLARMAIEAPSALVVAEAETGTVVAVNEAATSLFARSRSSLIGAHQTELHPPAEESRSRTGFDAVPTDHQQRVYADEEEAVRILRGDGEVVPVDVWSTTVTHRETAYVVGVFQDATDRLERQERLERQAAAMDISPSGIALLNEEGVYTYLNEAHVTMFGYDDAEELLGGSWKQFYDDTIADHIEREVFPVLEAEGTWDGELVGRRKDGSPLTQRVALGMLPDGGLACVNIDLTERERTRERIEETRALVETLMTAADRKSVIESVIDAIAAIVDRPLAGYWAHDESAEALIPVEVSTQGTDIVETVPSFEPGASVAWEAFERGEPRYCADLRAESTVHNPDTPIGSEFIVPVGDDGVLIVGSPLSDDVPSEDRELIVIIARHLQTALTLANRRHRLQDARERIAAERNQLKQVIDTVPQLIFAKNPDGEFILANEAVADAYGTTVDGLIGSTDADYASDPEEVDAFTADDRRVLETDESLYRTEETLTDAAGNERVLETWKIPFSPVESDDEAVLGVANDITELTDVQAELNRQRQLTNLYTVSNRVLQASTSSDAFEACVAAVADVVSNDQVVIYARDEDDGALVRRAIADESTAGEFPARIEPGQGDAWRAFGSDEPQWIDGDRFGTQPHESGADGLLTVSLDGAGVLAVSVDDRDPELESFIGAVARQVTAALTQLRQQRSIQSLSDDITESRARAAQYRALWEAVVDAVESIADARTRDAVYDAVLAFGEEIAAYAVVGTYDSVTDRIDPTAVSAAGGPGKLYDRDERFPAVVAGATDTTQHVSDNAPDEHGAWATQLLYFGYRSSIAVPLSHRGTVHGVVELASPRADTFGTDCRQAVEAIGTAAGARLSSLETGGQRDEAVTFDIECRDPPIFFPDLPREGSVVADQTAVAGDASLLLKGHTDGYTTSTIRSYVAQTPGLELESITKTGTGTHDIELRAVNTPQTDVRALLDALDRNETRLVGIRARPDATVFGFHTRDPTRIAAVRAQLEARSGTCSLVAKRQVSAEGGQSAGRDAAVDLTDRQHEILESALRQGYYDDPRATSGSDLADRFDVSSSTLHQHLRAAEAKVIREFFDE